MLKSQQNRLFFSHHENNTSIPSIPNIDLLGIPHQNLGMKISFLVHIIMTYHESWTPGTPLRGLGTTINLPRLSGIDNTYVEQLDPCNWSSHLNVWTVVKSLYFWPEFYGYHVSHWIFSDPARPSPAPSCSSRPHRPNSEFRSPSRRWHCLICEVFYYGKMLGTSERKPPFFRGCVNNHTLKHSFKDTNFWNVPIWNSSSGIAAVGKQTYANMITIYACMCVYIYINVCNIYIYILMYVIYIYIYIYINVCNIYIYIY